MILVINYVNLHVVTPNKSVEVLFINNKFLLDEKD